MQTNTASLADFEHALRHRGLQDALLFLNARVPHRFTSVYRIHDDRLHRMAFVDKLGSHGEALAEAAFKDSFCEIAVQEGSLSSPDIASDGRLQNTPNPGNFGCYVGVPLALAPGALFGTLCHADVEKHSIANDEFDFLQQATKVLCAHLEQMAASPDQARTG